MPHAKGAKDAKVLPDGSTLKVQLSKREAMERLRARFDAAKALACAGLRDKPMEELAALAGKHQMGTNVNGWVNPFPKEDPRSLLLEYQFGWSMDRSRFKAGLMSRQSGKDFSSEEEAAEDCQARPKTEWMIAAPSERQSLDSLEQGKTWAQGFDLMVEDFRENREGGSETLLKSAEILFSNGSRMRAVPGKPNTVRGRSANLLLTEFDFFEQPAETWRAVYPSITNPLRGGEKRVRLITTPNGIGGGMHRIWTKVDKHVAWSRHLVTIYHAVLMGLPVDIEALKEGLDDLDGWSQEYLCQFLDASSVLLPYELIAGCEDIEASAVVPGEFWATAAQRALVLGIDFGRKRDLTVCWCNEVLGDVGHTREVLELQGMSTPDQVEILGPRIQAARRVCLDYTGPGIGLGDYLVKLYGEWNPEHDLFGKVELVTFTNEKKLELFSKLKMAFEGKKLRVPISVAIREDLHSVNRIVSGTGTVTYRAPHTADGHADRCTALALANRAQVSAGVCSGRVVVFPDSRRGRVISGRRNREVVA